MMDQKNPAPKITTFMAQPANPKKVKKKGKVNLFKAANLMLRRLSSSSDNHNHHHHRHHHNNNSKSKKVNTDAASKSAWRRLFGSMRPLNLEVEAQNSPSPIRRNITGGSADCGGNMVKGTRSSSVQSSPMSPTYDARSHYTSSECSMSQYASVENLQALDRKNEEHEEKVGERNLHDDENGTGDEMIDAKAEEFIARFYAQMRLQRMNTADRRYKEMMERSIA